MGHPGWGAASSADGWSFHPWLGPQTLSYLRYRIPRAGNNSCQFFLCYGNTVDEIAEFVIVFHVDAARLNRVGRRSPLSHDWRVALNNIGQRPNIQFANCRIFTPAVTMREAVERTPSSEEQAWARCCRTGAASPAPEPWKQRLREIVAGILQPQLTTKHIETKSILFPRSAVSGAPAGCRFLHVMTPHASRNRRINLAHLKHAARARLLCNFQRPEPKK
jgi:hypothetical protein